MEVLFGLGYLAIGFLLGRLFIYAHPLEFKNPDILAYGMAGIVVFFWPIFAFIMFFPALGWLMFKSLNLKKK